MTKLKNSAGEDRQRLSDAVYETLVESILSGRFAPGTVLSELSLSAKLDVSRTPVHDALRQLAKDGLVAQRANRRAVVAHFSAADVYDIFEMRKLLEGEAARRAAQRIDRSALRTLQEATERMSLSLNRPGAIAKWAAFDELFHATIAASAGSIRLESDIRRYRMLHGSFNRLGTTVEALRGALEEHRRILAALARRSAEESAAAMVAHIHEWQAFFVARFSGSLTMDKQTSGGNLSVNR